MHLELNINKYNPLRASSYIKLPEEIMSKQAVVNIRNNDEFCFCWAVMSALYPPSGLEFETTSYPDFRTVLDVSGIDFPISLKDINKFEEQNNISINVYALEKIQKNFISQYEVIGPLHYSKSKKERHINLLLVSDESENTHYCYISDLSRLISSQISKHNGKKFLCDGCLQYFKTEENLVKHNTFDCDFVRINLPTENLKTDKFGNNVPSNILKFENIHKQMKVPFVIYADFECILKRVNDNKQHLDPHASYTVKQCEHIPYSFAYYIKCCFDDTISKFELYRGLNCAHIFINSIEKDVIDLYSKFLKSHKNMKPLSELQKIHHNYTNKCHICDKPILDSKEKVADHCHITGSYRGPAHSVCNLNYKLPTFVPVILHNLRNYDSHLFIKNLCQNKEQVSVIAQNKEKYISFEKHIDVDMYVDRSSSRTKTKKLTLRFIDSFQFLPYSLAKLAETLKDDQCREVKKYFTNSQKFHYIRQKGVFPYRYLDEFTKLNETELPEREQFYNDLTDEHITLTEYERAKSVWNLFECKTIGEYSDIYLQSDTLLLADIFENFRHTCINTYKLDPAHYYTFPGLSFDACLRYTGVELELLTDPDMLHFFKNSVRGGVSTCICRKSIANNPFLSHYDLTKPNKYIMYLDATNLYGYAMSQYLPKSNFAWVSNEKIENFDVMSIPNDSDKGYVLEVDIDYPSTLHDEHNEFPFCPQNYQPPKSKFAKLIPNLENKTKYVVHYTMLKQCIKNGLKVTKIHRIVEFTQSKWLKNYIDLNTKLRNESKNNFDRNTYKLANNSVYGKTMENVDRRIDIRLVTEWSKNRRKDGAENLIAKPYFKDLTIFSENLVAIQMQKVLVTYDKPIYVGFSILDISKTVMYDFFMIFLNLYTIKMLNFYIQILIRLYWKSKLIMCTMISKRIFLNLTLQIIRKIIFMIFQ